MKRRDFLKLSLQVILMSSIARASQAASTLIPSNADVIIIGAGISGIAAARALKAKGYNVLILEARNRVGGRIWTDNSLGTPLDLGASWIHGINNNPIKQLADQFALKTLPTNYEARQIFDVNGTPLSDNTDTTLSDRYETIYERVIAIQEQMLDDDLNDISWQNALTQELSKENFSSTELQELYFSLNTELEHEYGADLNELSLFNFDEGSAFKGVDHLFSGGYGQLIDKLIIDGKLTLNIRLNQVVKSIDYTQSKGVKVTTDKNVFSALAVLVTLPLGVLKANTVKFIPALPQTKQNSIKKLGFGTLNKTYFQFPNCFWTEDDDNELFNFISSTKGHWSEWLNIHHYNQQSVLLGFNAGKYGKDIESLSDQALISDGMQTLQKIYGKTIPSPKGYLITRWNADPYAKGSYSFIGVGASIKDYDELAKPVNNRVFFAGEATSSDYAATVHGAFLSGEREAKKIMSAVPLLKSAPKKVKFYSK
jgi:monoamine oxidase